LIPNQSEWAPTLKIPPAQRRRTTRVFNQINNATLETLSQMVVQKCAD